MVQEIVHDVDGSFEFVELTPELAGYEPPVMNTCIICGNPVPDYTPQYCCGGFECNCRGLPIEPPVCSGRCSDVLFQYRYFHGRKGTK